MKQNLDFEPYDFKVDKELEFAFRDRTDTDEPFSGVTAYLETYFDVDKKFGLNICNNDTDEYINLYADIHMPEKKVVISYIMQYGDNDGEQFYPEISDADKALILKEIEWMHKTTYGETLDETWDKFVNEQTADDNAIKDVIAEIHDLIEKAGHLLNSLSNETQEIILNMHNDSHSLNHCLRWGETAASEIIEALEKHEFGTNA